MPRPPQEEQERQEKALLNRVRVNSFVADPPTIAPFRRTTLRWDVELPVSNDPDVAVGVMLGNDIVPATGSRVVAPLFPAVYQLKAAGELASKELKKLSVNVDFSRCVLREVSEEVLGLLAAGEIAKFFDGVQHFTIKTESIVTALNTEGLKFSVPFKVLVPNWFDADMDVAITFGLRAVDRLPSLDANMVAHVDLRNVSVDIRWHFLEHVLSLGCTAAVQHALEVQAKAFIVGFIGPRLADLVRQAVQAMSDAQLALASTPTQPLALHSIFVGDRALVFRYCPR